MSGLRASITKLGYRSTISREMAITMGLIEPTPAEQAELGRRRAESDRRTEARTAGLRLARAQLAALPDPTARAVLALHREIGDVTMFGRFECEHCISGDMDDHDLWPCPTVEAVAQANSIEIPKW